MLLQFKKYRMTMLTNWMVCVLIGSALLSSCKKDEGEVSANQVQLEVFGPSPVLRGGELRFIGQNMDKISSVVLADGKEITDIEVVNNGEIRVRVPQDAVPGAITLKYADGEIKTKTLLTFSEPIVIEQLSTLQVKAGEVIAIEGDYLNLIKQVIFAKDVVVEEDDFISHTREKIEVTVPRAARTGKISLSNGEEIPIVIYSEEDVEVTLPTIVSIAPNPVKPGKGLIIKGTDFQLVESILFPDDISVTEFTINDAFTEILVDVPEQAKEGHVKAVAYSGVEILSEELALLAPEITSMSPTPVKNGATLTIAGTNLDLVTAVMFAGDVEGEIVVQEATSLEITVPVTARDGVVVLSTHSGKTAQADVVLVRPTITSLSPTSLMAGETVSISGTNLDLVTSIVFGEGHRVDDVQALSGTTLQVNVPMAAESGIVTLVMANETQVSSSQTLTVTSPNIPVITKIPASAKPGELIRIEGTKLHLVESVYFQNNVKATQYGSRSESLIEVYIPQNAVKGTVRLKLVTFDGTEVESSPFTISGVDPVVDESYVFFDFDGKNSWWGTIGAVESDSELSISGQYYRIDQSIGSGWQDFFWKNGRGDLKTEGVTVSDWAIKMDVNVLGATTQEFKFRLKGTDGDFWAIIPGMANKGGWYTVTIPLTDFRNDNGYGDEALPNVQNIDSDFGLATNGDAGVVDMCIDNVRFEKIR